MRKRYPAIALGLFAVQVPGGTADDDGDDEYEDGQAAFHPVSRLMGKEGRLQIWYVIE
jgi:hypothetical protein